MVKTAAYETRLLGSGVASPEQRVMGSGRVDRVLHPFLLPLASPLIPLTPLLPDTLTDTAS